MEWYLVIHRMSIPEALDRREEIDESTELLKLRYPKRVRLQIRRIREAYKRRLKNLAFLLCSEGNIYVAPKENVSEIKRLFEEADRALKSVDERLGASVLLLPVSNSEPVKILVNYAVALHTMNLIKNNLRGIRKLTPERIANLRKLINKAKKLVESNGGDEFLDSTFKELADVIETRSPTKVLERIVELKEEIKEIMKEKEEKEEVATLSILI